MTKLADLIAAILNKLTRSMHTYVLWVQRNIQLLIQQECTTPSVMYVPFLTNKNVFKLRAFCAYGFDLECLSTLDSS